MREGGLLRNLFNFRMNSDDECQNFWKFPILVPYEIRKKWKCLKSVEIDFVPWVGCKTMNYTVLKKDTALGFLSYEFPFVGQNTKKSRNCCFAQKHGERSSSCQLQVLHSICDGSNRFCRFRFLCAWCADQIRKFLILKTSSLKRPFQCGHNHLLNFRFQQHKFSSNKYFWKFDFAKLLMPRKILWVTKNLHVGVTKLQTGCLTSDGALSRKFSPF